MKAIKSLLVAATAAIAMAAVPDAQADRGTGAHGGSGSGSHGGTWRGGHSGGGHYGGGHYGGHYYGGHWRGGYWPRWGFYVGAPLLWSSWYWGWPYYYDYYPRTVYYDYPAASYPAYPDGVIDPPTQAEPGPGAPTQAPAYMNYCESAKAYYPKVTSCPEGWRFIPPR